MTLEALIFGGIGSLVECADLDRAAWNAAFRTHDLRWEWSWDTYVELMRVGGDRQLAARYAEHLGESVEAEALDQTHQRHLATMLSEGIPLRPGVERVVKWAARGGVRLGLVTRADADPVHALLQATARQRGGVVFDVVVLRGDVAHLAPDPAAMSTAMADLRVAEDCAVVVTDTPVNTEAALAARLPVLGFPGRMAEAEPDGFGPVPQAHVLSPEAVASAWRGAGIVAAE